MTVNRWHSNRHKALRNSCDDIDHHQIRVMGLAVSCARYVGEPITANLTTAALTHDEAERILGDMPAPAKARFPDLAEAYAKAEAQVMAELGHAKWQEALTDEEAAILRLADLVDAWQWARQRIGAGYMNDDGWPEHLGEMKTIAAVLGALKWLEERLND